MIVAFHHLVLFVLSLVVPPSWERKWVQPINQHPALAMIYGSILTVLYPSVGAQYCTLQQHETATTHHSLLCDNWALPPLQKLTAFPHPLHQQYKETKIAAVFFRLNPCTPWAAQGNIHHCLVSLAPPPGTYVTMVSLFIFLLYTLETALSNWRIEKNTCVFFTN